MLDFQAAARRQLRMSPEPKEDQSLLRPLSPKLRDWRMDMSAEDRHAFEAVAGELLIDLGYPIEP